MARFNPYIIGAPVRDTAFYGREKLINVVRDTLSIPTVNLLVFYGQRRIGKTSLLQNLNGHAELSDFIFIYQDAVDIADKTSYETLYYFSQKIAQATGLKALTQAQLQQDEGLFQREFLPKAYAASGHKRLVLLIDEFDIFEYKRQIGDSIQVIDQLLKSETNLAFIVALGRGKEFQTQLALILKAGHGVKVSLLEEDETRRLITEPAHNQLNYLPEAVEAVIGLTAGHPYYTQLLCYEIFNELQSEGGNQVRVADVQRAAAKALDTGSGGFGWLWEGLAPAERLVLALMAEAAEDSFDRLVAEKKLTETFVKRRIHRQGVELTDALKQLIDLDIIERKGPAQYRYVVELIRRWVREKHPVSQERDNNLTLLSKRATDEFSAGQANSDPNAAIHHYRAALAANPNHIEAQCALAGLLLKEGRINEAVDAYEAAYWLDETKAGPGREKAIALQGSNGKPSTAFNLRLVGVAIVLFVGVALGAGIFFLTDDNDNLPTPTPTNQAEVSSVTPTSFLVAAGTTTTTPLASTPSIATPTKAATPNATAVPTSSLTPTPLLSPTPDMSPTVLPPTATVTSTDTPTFTPTTIPPTLTPTVLPPTATTASTNTSTFTPTAVPPTLTPTETASPTPTPASLPAGPNPTAIFKYDAPTLIRPAPEALFTPNEDVILEWNPVGSLAANEQYAIRVVFEEGNLLITDGDQVKSTSWIIPHQLFATRANGPERRYEWYVFVEKVEGNGPNPPISPTSEPRVFYWR